MRSSSSRNSYEPVKLLFLYSISHTYKHISSNVYLIIISVIFEQLMQMAYNLYSETCVSDEELLETFLVQENWRRDRREIVQEILLDRQAASECMALTQSIALQNRARLQEAAMIHREISAWPSYDSNSQDVSKCSHEPKRPKPSSARPHTQK